MNNVENESLNSNAITPEQYGEDPAVRLAYVQSIFQEYGCSTDDETLRRSIEVPQDLRLIKTFFKDSGYGPATKLGKLVQIITLEQYVSRKRRFSSRTHFGGPYSTLPKGVSAGTEQYYLDLETIQTRLAQDIFVDHDTARQHAYELKECFFVHRNMRRVSPYGRKKRLQELVNRVAKNYPLTSR